MLDIVWTSSTNNEQSQPLTSVSYCIGSLALVGSTMAYIKKGSIPSLLSGGLVSIIYFIGGALTNANRKNGLYVSLAASVILLLAGIGRCFATSFQKAVPLVLSGLGLLSTLYFGSFIV